MSGTAPVKRPRHLMDPANPIRPVNDASLSNVQRWVLSVLAVSTVLHMAIGVAIGSLFVREDAIDARIGLNVIAAAFGVLAVAAGRLIHRASLTTPWLVVGVVPGVVGMVLALG
jgi:hypothetical protein